MFLESATAFNLVGLHPLWGMQLCKHLDSDHTAGLVCPFLVLGDTGRSKIL